jgi:DNA primase catalytic core
VDLVAFWENEVFPRLTAEIIYTNEVHKWHKSGDKWRGDCPWHDSKSHTSFSVTPASLLWWCPGCGVGGGPVQYVWRLKGRTGSPRGRDFVEIVRELAALAGVPFPERELSPEEQRRAERREERRGILEAVTRHCENVLWSETGQAARDYLHQRGLDDEAIRDLGLGLYPSVAEVRKDLDEWGCDVDLARQVGVFNPDFEGYITFPWADDAGRPLTIYGSWSSRTPPAGQPKKLALRNPRDGNGDPWEQTKRSPYLFNRARRAGHLDLVLVEGITDAAVAHRHGDTRVIGCVAAQLSRAQVETLAKHKARSVTICLDPDKAGEAGIRSCINSLMAGGITAYVAPQLPDGLDPDEYILTHGIDAWRSHIASASHALRWKARSLLEQYQGDGWTDAAKDSVMAAAVEFAAHWGGDRDDELARHFWPEVLGAIGGDAAAVGVRVAAARAARRLGRVERPHLEGNGRPVVVDGVPTPPWDEAPVPLSETPPPPFPLDALPADMRDYVEQVAASMPCPVDLVAVAALAAAAAAIGNSRALLVKEGWTEWARLWLAIVSDAGSKKSPALAAATRPIRDLQRRYKRAYREAMEEYERQLAGWEAEHKRGRRQGPAKAAAPAANGVRIHDPGRDSSGADESRQQKPEQPKMAQVFTSDSTREGLAGLLEDNPRGLLVYRDELTGWALSINQYKKKGDDRQFWLSVWSGGDTIVNRAKDRGKPTAYLQDPVLSVVGCLPPSVLGLLQDEREHQDDGFVHRILFAWPPPADGGWTEVTPHPDAIAAFEQLFTKLFALESGTDDQTGDPRPVLIRWRPGGKRAWVEHVEQISAELRAGDLPDALRGPWRKFEGYGARLALVIHVCRHASGETPDRDVDEMSMRSAMKLVDYFKAHARRVYPCLTTGGAVRLEKQIRAVLDWIVRGRRQTFTCHECYRDLHHSLGSAEECSRVLAAMEDHGYIREKAQQRQGSHGRKPKPAYDVHPSVCTAKLTKSTKCQSGAEAQPISSISSISRRVAEETTANDPSGEGWEEGEV